MSMSAPMPSSPPAPHDASTGMLLDTQAMSSYPQVIQASVQRLVERWQQLDQPYSGISPQALGRDLDAVDLDQPLPDLEAALDETRQLYLRDAMYFHHPAYVAHLNCPVLLPALAAEVLIAAVNSSLDTWDQSLGASLIEQKLMDWTAARCGLGAAADGVMTSGGTQSNLMAMLLARDIAAASQTPAVDIREQGLPADFHRMKILAGDSSHFSLQKAAALLGLGHQAVLSLPCDRQGCLPPDAVAQALQDCRRRGERPILLVATAGSTDFGSIDPLPALAALCRQQQLRLHVDAAYGGGLLVSNHYRQRLQGVEAADSVTIDYHKSYFQPVSCSALLVRDRRDWRYLTYHADYLNPAGQSQQGRPDLVNKSLQTTRRFDALKLWLSLRSLGPDAIGALFDRVLELATASHHWLRQQDDVELATSQPPMLSTLLLRYRPYGWRDPERIDRLNQDLRRRLFDRGEVIVGGTRRHQRHYLKFTLLNPRTRLSDIQALWQRIRDQAAQLLSQDPELRSEGSRP